MTSYYTITDFQEKTLWKIYLVFAIYIFEHSKYSDDVYKSLGSKQNAEQDEPNFALGKEMNVFFLLLHFVPYIKFKHSSWVLIK